MENHLPHIVSSVAEDVARGALVPSAWWQRLEPPTGLCRLCGGVGLSWGGVRGGEDLHNKVPVLVGFIRHLHSCNLVWS